MRMKGIFALGAMALFLGTAACTAEVEDPGEAPSVDVDPGQAPDIDVDPARVDVGTDTQTVTVPDVDVTPTEGNDP